MRSVHACMSQRDSIGLHNEGGRKGGVACYTCFACCNTSTAPSFQIRFGVAHAIWRGGLVETFAVAIFDLVVFDLFIHQNLILGLLEFSASTWLRALVGAGSFSC
jgi:hypothetical protein